MKYTGLTLTLLFLMALCPIVSGDPIKFVTPEPGTTVTDPGFQAEFEPSVDPSSIRVEINGTDMNPSFYTVTTAVPGPPAGVTTGGPAKGKVEGDMDGTLLNHAYFNDLRVWGLNQGGQIVEAKTYFLWFEMGDANPIIDAGTLGNILGTITGLIPTIGKTGPDLRIDSPAMGDFVGRSTPFQVHGTATDPAQVSELVVSIDSADPEDIIHTYDPVSGKFTFDWKFDVPGLHKIVVAATNPSGGRSTAKISVHAGDPWQPGEIIENSSQIQLTSHGIDMIGNMIEPSLTPKELYKQVAMGQSVWDQSFGLIDAEMDLLAIGHENINLHGSFEDGFLHITADVTQLEAQARFEMNWLFAKITAHPIVNTGSSTWDAWVKIEKDPGKGIQLTIDRHTLLIEQIEGRIPGVPDFVVNAALDFLKGFIQTAVETALGEQIVPALEKLLNDYFFMAHGPHSSSIFNLVDITVDGELSFIEVQNDQGRFHNRSGIRATYPEITPNQAGWMATPESNGYLDFPLEQDGSLAIPDDLFNCGLYALWESGLLHLNLQELISDAQTNPNTLNSISELIGDKVDLSKILNIAGSIPINILLRPMLAPVMIMGHHDCDVILQLHELYIDIYLVLPQTEQLLFSVSLDIDIPLNDWIMGDGFLSFQLGKLDLGVDSGITPHIGFQIAQMPLITIPTEGMSGLITEIAYMALPFILEIVHQSTTTAGIDFPLDNEHIRGENDHLILTADLNMPEGENGGDPFGAETVDEEEDKLKIKFCGLIGLAGGTHWEYLLESYRGFRDEILRKSPGGESGIEAYYQYSVALTVLLSAYPQLETPAMIVFVVVGVLLTAMLYTQGLFWVWCAFVLAFLWRNSLARLVSRVLRGGELRCTIQPVACLQMA